VRNQCRTRVQPEALEGLKTCSGTTNSANVCAIPINPYGMSFMWKCKSFHGTYCAALARRYNYLTSCVSCCYLLLQSRETTRFILSARLSFSRMSFSPANSRLVQGHADDPYEISVWLSGWSFKLIKLMRLEAQSRVLLRVP
jgi:hypothetical protein